MGMEEAQTLLLPFGESANGIVLHRNPTLITSRKKGGLLRPAIVQNSFFLNESHSCSRG